MIRFNTQIIDFVSKKNPVNLSEISYPWMLEQTTNLEISIKSRHRYFITATVKTENGDCFGT